MNNISNTNLATITKVYENQGNSHTKTYMTKPSLVLHSSKTKKKMSPCPSLYPVSPQAQKNETL